MFGQGSNTKYDQFDDGDDANDNRRFWKRKTSDSSRLARKGLRRGQSTGTTSTGSFSQSEDFRRMLSEDHPPSSQNLLNNSDNENREEQEVYIVKQQYGYLSILFSTAQTIILAIMMTNCGVAPMNINPMVGPYPDALSEWGAKNAVNILDDGEWWRLITPIMLHAGVIHLLCNVAVQLETGAFFEREWGSGAWLVIYLVSAVGSSILSVIYMTDAVSVGSSGAVMGLFGAKLAEIICRWCESTKTEQARVAKQVRKEQCAGVTCSVVVVMLFSFIPYGKFLKSWIQIYLVMDRRSIISTYSPVPSFSNPSRLCSFFYSGLGRSPWRFAGWILHWNVHLRYEHQNGDLEDVLVPSWNRHNNMLFWSYVTRNVLWRC